uniref:Uncharacterized protein n=1 Tax=Nelumbo nucifera TaxID=4432 RepID=A0A822YR57_NELNU|nr:TPA_asm: hypothetical protein HUJ06_004681 [Nelumbo nucifera]
MFFMFHELFSSAVGWGAFLLQEGCLVFCDGLYTALNVKKREGQKLVLGMTFSPPAISSDILNSEMSCILNLAHASVEILF